MTVSPPTPPTSGPVPPQPPVMPVGRGSLRTALFLGLAFWAVIGAFTMGNAWLLSGTMEDAAQCRPLLVNGFANLPYFLFWALLTPVIWLVIQRFAHRSTRFKILGLTAFGLALAITSYFFKSLTKELVIHGGWPDHAFGIHYLRMDTFYPDLLVAGASVVGLLAWDTYRRLRQRQLQTAELESRLAKARLQSLQMQIHPHFLFNTLNTISALVERNPKETRRVIARLSDMLRTSLDKGEELWVPLEEELAFLENYLDIERVRFGKRLSVDWIIDSAVKEVYIPSFLIQPLVENAIRHGISRITYPGHIHIHITAVDHQLEVRVRDNGPGCGPGEPERQGGIGLTNVRQRLQQHFGSRGSLILGKPERGGCEAVLRLPLLDERLPILPDSGLAN